MHVLAGDVRPPSALGSELLDRPMVVGGALIAVGAHLLLPLAIALGISLLAHAGAGELHPDSFIEEHVVEARFVRLGKKPDPNKLPQRIVPRLQTAPDLATAVSKEMEPPKPEKPDAGPRPEQPVEDLLTRLGDRAQTFAEIADEQEREGDPEGIAEGTETEAQLGDIYLGKLKAFFERGWTIPTTLGDTSKLVAHADVQITADLHVGPSEVVKASGEPLFDQSIEDRFQQLRTLQTTLPEPPPEVAGRFLGQTLRIRFHGQRQ